MNRNNKQLLWVNILLIPLVLLSCNNARQGSTDNSNPATDSIIGDMENLTPVVDTINKKVHDSFSLLDTIENESLEKRISEQDVFYSETISHDTIIGDFYISYIVRDNDDIVYKQIIYDEGDTVKTVFADRSAFIDLRNKDGKIILSNKEINRYTFQSIIPRDIINQYQLWYFGIEKVDKEGVLFDLNVCIPDTDNCYSFDLHVSKEGKITISQTESVWEDDYD